MTDHLAAEMLSLAPPPTPRRPRVLVVGSVVASAAAAAAILGLVAIYLSVRADTLADGGTWLPEGTVIPLTPANMGLTSLLMSAVTMQWAVYALRNADRAHAYLALGVTLLLGISFLNSTAYLYSQTGLGIASSGQAVLIYTITGAHLAMTIAGLLFAVVMGFQALGGQLTGRAAEGMAAAALFWYVTIGVYAVVWYAIYITK
jgi:heme/copper-type cytochrome/quinol oxidase subunit 3